MIMLVYWKAVSKPALQGFYRTRYSSIRSNFLHLVIVTVDENKTNISVKPLIYSLFFSSPTKSQKTTTDYIWIYISHLNTSTIEHTHNLFWPFFSFLTFLVYVPSVEVSQSVTLHTIYHCKHKHTTQNINTHTTGYISNYTTNFNSCTIEYQPFSSLLNINFIGHVPLLLTDLYHHAFAFCM